jgi:hypothetical protein
MVGAKKIKFLVRALAVVTVLALSSTGWAKPSFGGPGIAGDLDNTGTHVDVSVPVRGFAACDPSPATGITQTYALKVYIFQPSGRMFAIGIGSSSNFTCGTNPNATVAVDADVDALAGLSFKPGPATLVYQVIQTTTDSTDPLNPTVTVLTVDEYGSRIDLH